MYFHITIIFGVLLIILQNCLAVPVEQRQNHPFPLTKADAKKAGFSDEEWDSPSEEWAEAREKNGGNRDIKSWPGSGTATRILHTLGLLIMMIYAKEANMLRIC